MRRVLMVMIMSVMFSGTAFAMHGPGMGRMMPGGHGHGIIKALLHLDLTDTQKHEIALVLKKNKQARKAKFEAMHEAMQGLREATEKTVFDEEAVRQAYQAVAEAGEEMALQKARITAELKGLLTPEQLETLQDHTAKMRNKMKSRWKNRPQLLDEWIELHSQVDGNE